MGLDRDLKVEEFDLPDDEEPEASPVTGSEDDQTEEPVYDEQTEDL